MTKLAYFLRPFQLRLFHWHLFLLGLPLVCLMPFVSACDGLSDGGSECADVQTYAVSYCEDASLPQAGDGCFPECDEEGVLTCDDATCTHAWIGCGPDADCDVCGGDAWICM